MFTKKRSWHFWKDRPCPNLITGFFNNRSSIIRKERSIAPPAITVNRTILNEPVIFNKSVQAAKEICDFWRTYYKSADWTANINEADVYDILGKDKTTIIGVRNPEGQLVGTVASIPLTGQFLHHREEIKQAFFLVDYLVLHPLMRGRGVAGWLLGWLDYLTSKKGPVIHCWFRESYNIRGKLSKMVAVPFSRMNTLHISYVSLATRPHPEHAQEITWHSVRKVLNDIKVSKEFSFDLMYIPNDTYNTTWWRVELLEYPSCALIVGIKNTGKMKSNNQCIYNVVFTCFVRLIPGNVNDIAEPFWATDSYIPALRSSIEAAAFTQKCDIITVSDNSTCGDDYLEKWPQWRIANRKRKLYMYNWRSPTIGSIVWPV